MPTRPACSPARLAWLAFALPVLAADSAEATNLLYDDGMHHVLDSVTPLLPDPDESIVEVVDGPGATPTSLDVSLGTDLHSIHMQARGHSSIQVLDLGGAWLETFDDSAGLIEAGSLGPGWDPLIFDARDRSTLTVRETVWTASAHNDSTVLLESIGYVGGFYAYDQSTTVLDGGLAYSVILFGSSTMTVLGGRVGVDAVRVWDDAHLIVDGGAIETSYGLEVRQNGRVDIHSHSAYDPFGPFEVSDFGILTLFGSDFTLDGVPLGHGDHGAGVGGALAGLLSGTLESGDTLNVEVSIADSGILRIVPEPGPGALILTALAALLGTRPVARTRPALS